MRQPTEPSRPYALAAGEGLGGDPALKASAASTGGALTVIDSDTDGGAPPHVHDREDEALFVLSGRIIVEVGEEHHELEAGSFVFLPRRVPHAWDVAGERARVLIIAIPAGLEEFLVEFHAARDQGERAAVAARHGQTLLP